MLGTRTHGDGGCGQVRRGWGSARVQGQLCKAGAGARSNRTLASGRRYGAELLLAGTVFFHGDYQLQLRTKINGCISERFGGADENKVLC